MRYDISYSMVGRLVLNGNLGQAVAHVCSVTPSCLFAQPLHPRTHQDDKLHIMDAAEKEIDKMLQENLLQNFQTTEKFKEINGMLLSITASTISA